MIQCSEETHGVQPGTGEIWLLGRTHLRPRPSSFKWLSAACDHGGELCSTSNLFSFRQDPADALPAACENPQGRGLELKSSWILDWPELR